MKALLDGELWEDVHEYEGLYQVSNFGRIKSLPRQHLMSGRHPDPYLRSYGERYLKPSLNTYATVNLHKSGKVRRVYVHRLVAFHFRPRLAEHTEVNHIDGDKLNNHHSNLEWVTSSQNQRHAVDVLKKNRGVLIKTSVLQEQDVLAVKNLLLEGELSQKEIAARFGVSISAISRIKRGDNWSWLTGFCKGVR